LSIISPTSFEKEVGKKTLGKPKARNLLIAKEAEKIKLKT